MTLPIRPGTAAARALDFIALFPGVTFSEIHAATNPNAATFRATSRATDRLLLAGLIRKERDGRCVRHFIADETKTQ